MPNVPVNEEKPSSKPPAGDDYRKYLERTGVTDMLKRLLVILYEEQEWPINPMEFLCMKLNELASINLFEKLKEDVESKSDKIKELERTIIKLEIELREHKAKEEEDQDIANTTTNL